MICKCIILYIVIDTYPSICYMCIIHVEIHTNVISYIYIYICVDTHDILYIHNYNVGWPIVKRVQ